VILLAHEKLYTYLAPSRMRMRDYCDGSYVCLRPLWSSADVRINKLRLRLRLRFAKPSTHTITPSLPDETHQTTTASGLCAAFLLNSEGHQVLIMLPASILSPMDPSRLTILLGQVGGEMPLPTLSYDLRNDATASPDKRHITRALGISLQHHRRYQGVLP
jgi:hypothetical protein